jgi:hypothetical protein
MAWVIFARFIYGLGQDYGMRVMVWDVHYTFKNGLGHCFEDPYMIWGKTAVWV